jgi:3-hydroxyisobutyrate dehydrogenase-like beta-hydroxyacid dehydrogenase
MTTQQPATGDRARVSVLGLGRMGTALATALLADGYRTTVWNRSAAKADTLVGQGADLAETVTDAMAASPVVIICVSDYDAIHGMLDADPDAVSGRTLVNVTTGTPDQARALATWAADHGADYLDGAMMAVPQTVATSEAFFLYSGSEQAFRTHRKTLDTLASSHFLGNDPEVAELWDLALLGTGYATLTGYLHSLALLETAGVAPTRFVPLAIRWLNGMAAFMPELAQEIETQDYSSGVSPVDMNRHAVGNLVRTSRLKGVDADVHGPLRALLDRRVADGHGADSFSSLFELLRRRP